MCPFSFPFSQFFPDYFCLTLFLGVYLFIISPQEPAWLSWAFGALPFFFISLFIYIALYMSVLSLHIKRLLECWDNSQPQLWWGLWSRLHLWTSMSGSWQFPLLPAFPVLMSYHYGDKEQSLDFYVFSLFVSQMVFRLPGGHFWSSWASMVSCSMLDTSMGCWGPQATSGTQVPLELYPEMPKRPCGAWGQTCIRRLQVISPNHVISPWRHSWF